MRKTYESLDLDKPIIQSQLIDKRKYFGETRFTFSGLSNTKIEAIKKAKRLRKKGKLARVVYHAGLRKWVIYRGRRKK